VTAAIVVVCVVAGLLLAGATISGTRHSSGDTRTPARRNVSWLGSINLFVLVFN